MPRELTVTAQYPRDADDIFGDALSFQEMAEATRGVAIYRNLPDGDMVQGETYVIDVLVWRVMHNPHYTVHVETVDRDARRVQSREEGWMIRQWDHTLTIEALGGGACLWTDRLVIDCGWATGFMTWVARHLYRTRHRNRQGAGITARVRRI
ncbi:30S ribosomal protein S21 [Roseibacterium elongatum DSM 19469]|uniref:30S ribosomal protein S21 n=1 Tax=Roseicyclus elongatus DSM 19469 TaxID=1294273 RepID=W8SKQ9_9RHOB|nr:hypothetical protein [Roseibacterium elongatum]AHM03115.1 30S ribosomal protein S21 [Roseibacterium elongatum DSM 19469]